MRSAAVVLVTLTSLICASCGGGSGGSAGPHYAATAPPPATSATPSPPAAAGPKGNPSPVLYTLVDLGTLGGDVTPHGINSHDDVVGTSKVPGGGGHAFLYLRACACMQDLSLNPGEVSDAWAVDDGDTVAMDSASAANEPSGPAILWSSGGRKELPSTNPQVNQYGTPYALNASGVVVGSAWSAAGSAHATLWMPGNGSYAATDMGTLGGSFSRAMSVNDTGDAAGISDTDKTGNNCNSGNSSEARDRAFIYQHGKMQSLGTLSPNWDDSDAKGINRSDEIVGSSAFGNCNNNPAGLAHAFLWNRGAMTDLGTLAGNGDFQSAADAINDNGEVVGYSDVDGQHVHHAFLLESGGKMQDLNSLIDPSDPLAPYVTLSEATAINNGGDIAAFGSDSRDPSHRHGYLVVLETSGGFGG